MKRMPHLWVIALLSTALVYPLPTASAQYKNLNFTLDGGYDYMLISSVASNGNLLTPSEHSMRIADGGTIGGDIGIKLSHDHWWFIVRLNGKIYNYNPSADSPGSLNYYFDDNAQQTMGTLFGLEVMLGPRFYLLTDYNRPFIDLSLAYMHLFAFTSAQNNTCDNATCQTGTSNADNYLPQSNLLTVHARPGVEFIFHHDVALNFAVDIARWIVFGFPGNWMFGVSAGFTFFG